MTQPRVEMPLPILPQQAPLYRLYGPGTRCGGRVSACTVPHVWRRAHADRRHIPRWDGCCPTAPARCSPIRS